MQHSHCVNYSDEYAFYLTPLGQLKDDADDSSSCSTVDKPPVVEEVESEDEPDPITPEDCYTESETHSALLLVSPDGKPVTPDTILLKILTA